MQPHVRLTLMWFSRVFRSICAKVWDPRNFQALWDVATTLSLLEWELHVAFFDIMTHLTLHVVEKLDLCGLVHAKWMYLIEWGLKMFKTYVRNRAHPKASMAEGYIYDETIRFVTKYVQGFSDVQHHIWDACKEEGLCSDQVLEGVGIKFFFDSGCRDLACQYVFTNASCMAPWTR
jgi:hypothetical protein